MLKIAASFLVAAVLAARVSPVAANYSCVLSDPIALDSNGQVELQQFINEDEGTFTMKVIYYGQAYIGIGVNQEGLPRMTPAIVAIGRADGSNSRVEKYSMMPNSGVQLAASQEGLFNATFEQTASTSTLTFTQLLSEPGQVAITDDSQWIYAVGFPNNRFGGHAIRGSFQLPLSRSCTLLASSGIPGEDESGSAGIVVEEDEEGTAATKQVEETTGVAPSTDDVSPSSSSIQAAGIVFADVSKPDREMWMVHGILMAIAWGICAPVAIGASILRTGFARLGLTNDKTLWFQIHFYMNVGTALLTLAGFIIAVLAKNQQQMQDDEETTAVVHFQGTHAKMGLTIFIMVFLQSLAGRFRPSLPPKETESSIIVDGAESSKRGVVKKDQQDDLDRTERDTSAHLDFSSSFGHQNEQSTGINAKKSDIRIGWEWGHRLTGLALLGMAWYNCHTGIVWSSTVWEENEDWTGVFWGVVGGIVGIIIASRIVLQMTE